MGIEMPRFVARERFSLCGVVDQVLIFGCPMMPLHGLDAKNKSRCRAVIEKFCEQKGKTMIYVTHRIEEIPACVTLTFELKKET